MVRGSTQPLLEYVSRTAMETSDLGAQIAHIASGSDLIFLIGKLGSGKTTLAQGFARGLGITGPVTSPTFTLMRQYRCEQRADITQLVHVDLYRLDTLGEIEELGVLELTEAGAVALIEWGDAAKASLGQPSLSIQLHLTGNDEERMVSLYGSDPKWKKLVSP